MSRNFHLVPILKVCPGKITRVLRQEETEDSENKLLLKKIISNVEDENLVKSRKSQFELRLKYFNLKTANAELADENLNITWNFSKFPQSSVSLPPFRNSKSTMDVSFIYNLIESKNILKNYNCRRIIFTITSMKSEHLCVDFANGRANFSKAILKPNTTLDEDVEFHYLLENQKQKKNMFGTLRISYTYHLGERIHVNFDKILRKEHELGSAQDSRSISRSKSVVQNYESANSVLSKDNTEVTEAEVKTFQDALLLVLNRNKAWRTQQSEISKELRDRAEWLNEEALWRRTLQEFAILSGKDPFKVYWRHWRDENTSKVFLRKFPSEPENYEPILKIKIINLSFLPGASVYVSSRHIEQVYVEYYIFRSNEPEMESEQTLTKPPPGEPVVFNFEKTYSIDLRTKQDDCLKLAEMIMNKEIVRISVISEPIAALGELIQICKEIGYSQLCFFDIVQLQSNQQEIEFPIYDVKNGEIMGAMNVEISGILALRKMALVILAPREYKLIM